MTLHRLLVLGLVLVLAACGGGGGGSSGGSVGGNPPGSGSPGGDNPGGDPGGNDPGGDDSGGDDPGDDDPGDDGGDDTPAPSGNARAEIVFPKSRAVATAPTITVRGIASDPDGVANVMVNGVPATVTPAAASKRPLAAKAALAEGDVEWSVEIELASGSNEITVAIVDGGGDVAEGVANSTIESVQVPVYFNLDTDGERLVGLSYTLTPSGYRQHLVQHDYATGEQEIYDEIWTSPDSTCFRPAENEFLHMRVAGENVRHLYRYDLDTREDAFLFEIPSTVLDPGPGFEPGFFSEILECDSEHASAYLLVNYIDDDLESNGFKKSRVIEIPLDGTTVSTLTETDPAASDPWVVTNIALDDAALVAEQDFFGEPKPLTSVALLDGLRTELTPGLGAWGTALAPALDLNRVYLATFEGVDEVDLTVPSKRTISEVEPSHPLTFTQPRAIGFDPANNRVLVGDDELDMVIAIDLTSGDRSPLVARNIGEGTPLISPRAFALTADGQRAYVADDGSNAPARLFEIDLATGDRTTVGDIGTATQYVKGLALDETSGRVFVAGQDVIIAVDLQTGTFETIVDPESTDLQAISDLLLDAPNGRLLIADSVADGIFALDLESKDLEVISQEGVRGIGPAFEGAISMTRVGTSNELYVGGHNNDAGLVTRVNLETGDREALTHNCETSAFPVLTQVHYGEARNELIVLSDLLLTIDLESGQCTQLPQRTFVTQLRTTAQDQMLAVTSRAMLQVDRETGEVVIISK